MKLKYHFKKEDFLTARVDKNLPVCIDDEFESYQNQKTLVQADDDTLEVRSDEQNQDEDGIFFASGNVEIERANDLVKSDRAQFNADTGVLQTEGNVKYLTEDLTLYAEEGGYNSRMILYLFQIQLTISLVKINLEKVKPKICS